MPRWRAPQNEPLNGIRCSPGRLVQQALWVVHWAGGAEAQPNDLCAVQGVDLTDEELLSYISESSTMSKSIEEYEGAPAQLPALALSAAA